VLAFLAGERAVVDGELHLHGRRVDLDEGQRLHGPNRGEGLADVDVSKPAMPTMLPATPPSESAVARPLNRSKVLVTFALLLGAVLAEQPDGVALFHVAAEHLADGDAADVVVPVDVGDEHRERRRPGRPSAAG
jgi:hypothetical protein